MIVSLQGRVARVEADRLILELGGVGLEVYAPTPLLATLRVGETTTLHTHLVVREDSLTLYGFDDPDARHLFTLLLGVNGVGPRLALAILSTLIPDAIRRGVFHEQPEVFSRVAGVGKKTAQKIVLHLQGRLPSVAGVEVMGQVSEVDADVLAALTTLGYSVVEAQAAIQALPGDAPEDLEVRLKLALQYFTS